MRTEGCGWVVKQLFVTDDQIVKGLKTKDEVLKKPSSIFNNDIHQGIYIYPYAMIQPCMKNRKEYTFQAKVLSVCLQQGQHLDITRKFSQQDKIIAISLLL